MSNPKYRTEQEAAMKALTDKVAAQDVVFGSFGSFTAAEIAAKDALIAELAAAVRDVKELSSVWFPGTEGAHLLRINDVSSAALAKVPESAGE